MIEKFYLEKPSLERKNEALEYIKEILNVNKSIEKYKDIYVPNMAIKTK